MYKKVVSLTFSRGKDSNTHLIQYKIFIAQSLRFLKVDNDSFQGMLFDSNQYNSLGEDLRTYLFYSKTFLLPSDYSKKFYKLESAFSVDSENYRTLMTYVLPEVCKFEDPLTRDFLNKYLSITTAPKPNVDIPMESDFLAKTNQRFCPMGLGDILNRQMMFFKSKDVYSALAGFQDAIRCIDKAVKGVYSEYLNMRHEEDKQKVQTIIVELIEASDLVTCYLERLIQECYNSLFYGKESQKGIITDKNGIILGEHSGIYQFTIGQRKGLGLSHPTPLFVVDINPRNNTVIVGDKHDLQMMEAKVHTFTLINPNQSYTNRTLLAKTRYQMTPMQAKIKSYTDTTAIIEFTAPQSQLTPGQSCVLYEKDGRVVGGGIIDTRN